MNFKDSHPMPILIQIVIHRYWHDLVQILVVTLVKINCEGRPSRMDADVCSTGGANTLYIHLLFFLVKLLK